MLPQESFVFQVFLGRFRCIPCILRDLLHVHDSTAKNNYVAILSVSAHLYSISILICTLLSLTVILSPQLAIARALFYCTVQYNFFTQLLDDSR